MTQHVRSMLATVAMAFCVASQGLAAPPQPPTGIAVIDKPWDGGDQVRVIISRSADDDASSSNRVTHYAVERSLEQGGVFGNEILVDAKAIKGSPLVTDLKEIPIDEKVWLRAAAVNAAGERSNWVQTLEPVIAKRQWFDGGRFTFFLVLAIVCGAILLLIILARSGAKLWIRKMHGLDAIDEAVGRATEMGRPCLFVAGLQDLNEIETIAGITVLSRVVQKAAEYDATVIMPTSRSLVMTAARETTQGAYLAAGRPDAYQEDRIYYVTDEQFGFVAHVAGLMQREEPAACFYMGQFFAESLVLGETGNTINAIQIAGTAQPAQLPFFVAACDYTLIGEEFFAASAYLSGDPDQLGSLKGQDVGKLLVAGLLFVGCGLQTLSQLMPQSAGLQSATNFLVEQMQSGS